MHLLTHFPCIFRPRPRQEPRVTEVELAPRPIRCRLLIRVAANTLTIPLLRREPGGLEARVGVDIVGARPITGAKRQGAIPGMHDGRDEGQGSSCGGPGQLLRISLAVVWR